MTVSFSKTRKVFCDGNIWEEVVDCREEELRSNRSSVLRTARRKQRRLYKRTLRRAYDFLKSTDVVTVGRVNKAIEEHGYIEIVILFLLKAAGAPLRKHGKIQECLEWFRNDCKTYEQDLKRKDFRSHLEFFAKFPGFNKMLGIDQTVDEVSPSVPEFPLSADQHKAIAPAAEENPVCQPIYANLEGIVLERSISESNSHFSAQSARSAASSFWSEEDDQKRPANVISGPLSPNKTGDTSSSTEIEGKQFASQKRIQDEGGPSSRTRSKKLKKR